MKQYQTVGGNVRLSALLEQMDFDDMRLALKAHEGLHDCDDDTLTGDDRARLVELGLLRQNRRTGVVWESNLMVESIDEIEGRVRAVLANRSRLRSNAMLSGKTAAHDAVVKDE